MTKDHEIFEKGSFEAEVGEDVSVWVLAMADRRNLDWFDYDLRLTFRMGQASSFRVYFDPAGFRSIGEAMVRAADAADKHKADNPEPAE